MDLGIPDRQMGPGAATPTETVSITVSFPVIAPGGSVSPAGQITLDSGLMNPDLLAIAYRRKCPSGMAHAAAS